jgi:hypothetical protein
VSSIQMCMKSLQLSGGPSPRTCALCGLGPCKQMLGMSQPPQPVPMPDISEETLKERHFEACQRRDKARRDLKQAQSDINLIERRLGWLAND